LPKNMLPPALGEWVAAYEGLEPIFYGRVDENAQDWTGRDGIPQISAVGAGAVLRDDEMSMVYVDRDLQRFGPMSRAYEVTLRTAGYSPTGGAEVQPDTSTGLPAIRLALDRLAQAGATGNRSEIWYDAGQGNNIASVYYDWTDTDVNSSWDQLICASSVDSSVDEFSDLAAGAGTGTYTPAAPARFIAFSLYFPSAFTGDGKWAWVIRRVALFGDHGLTKRGSTPDEGFYTADIVKHVLSTIGGDVGIGTIHANTDYVVPQATYYEPVVYEQIVDDMAKLEGYHWGVWTDANRPRKPYLDFVSGPASATVYARRADCDSVRLAESLTSQHDSLRVQYTDPSGRSGYVTVTRSNARMGGVSRSATVSMGKGTSTSATAFGNMLLALEQAQARATGTVTIRGSIRSTSGGSGAERPVNTLRAGLDRIRLSDLPGSLYLGDDTRRFDTFRIQRVEVSYEKQVPVATLTLDAGINLIDVLQARMGLAMQTIGQ
jgi:hypothetical protein